MKAPGYRVDGYSTGPETGRRSKQKGMTQLDFQRLITKCMHGRSGDESPLILLESQLRGHPASRRSMIALDAECLIQAYGDRIEWSDRRGQRTFHQNPWDALSDFRHQYPGWLFGYLGYDLKNHIEILVSQHPDPVGAPDMLFFRPSELLVVDHQSGKVEFPLGESPRLRRLVEEMTGQTEDSAEDPAEDSTEKPFASEPIRLDKFASITPGEHYLERIRRAQEMIREGEFYEVNLSHLLQGRFTGDPYLLYRKMREQGPVPFGAYLSWDRWQVCSASPERFLCREGTRLFSQPIKGTAPRMIDPEQDRKVREQLLHSEKERAENLMIVDLVRHDLSKVSLPGTIRVPELFSLQRFETVHQLISTVEGRVDPGRDPVEILRACFPMGSMTGAPKIRAMEAIEELEDYRRGIYSGAIGYIGPEGDFDFNVVIRTAILHENRLYYAVGGAITSDSDPQQELEETWVKARALTHALHSV